MKTNTDYQKAKFYLKQAAKDIKEKHKTDKPMQRMYINDVADYLIKFYQFSEHKINLLSNYACKLHPKK